MWLERFPMGRVSTLAGDKREGTAFLLELLAEATPHGGVLYVDGGHCFNPYAYAEHNLLRDLPANRGAGNVHVIRAMTAYQWHQCLSSEVQDRLSATDDVGLVIVNPYDALLTHSDLEDWEAEAYARVTLRDLQATAKLHHIPIVLLTDFQRLWHQWPSIAMHIHSNVQDAYQVELINDAWRLSQGKVILGETRRIQRRITDYLPVVVSPDQTENPTTPLASVIA